MQTQTTQQFPTHARLGDLVLGPNPRRGKNPANEEMRASIRVKGVIQPVLVRPLGDGRLELRAGFTRYGLAKDELGEDYLLPIHVRDMGDDEAEEFSLIENVQRGGMNPAEEAESAARILARVNGDRDEAARRLGWNRQTLEKRLGLMNAVDTVRDALVDEKINLGHAELLAGLPKDKQPAVLQMLLGAPKMPTVAELKDKIAALAQKLADAIFDKGDCAGCANNSGNQQALFGEAIADGHCTNRECYTAKTEAALDGIKESLKDEYPEIRIVRPGENFTVIKLVADGDAGVGEEQAKLCKACGKFGAAISAVPGKTGNIYRGLCFDKECNGEKVKARQKLAADAAKAAQQAEAEAKSKGASPEKAADAGKAAAKKVAAEKAPAAQAQDSTRVKEYRTKVWRLALWQQLVRNPQLNDEVLLALALSGNGRNISGKKVQLVYEKLAGEKRSPLDIAEAMDSTATLVDRQRDTLRTAIAASVAEGVEEHALIKLVKRCNTNLADSWKLNDEYLNLLTKSEIEVVTEQIGLKAHLEEKAYAKLFAGKKDEIVKKVLAVENFDFAGKIPVNLTWDKQ
jgi:ParB family chromosome partitioning protein